MLQSGLENTARCRATLSRSVLGFAAIPSGASLLATTPGL